MAAPGAMDVIVGALEPLLDLLATETEAVT